MFFCALSIKICAVSFVKLILTKEGKPGNAERVGIEDVPNHAVDIVVVNVKIIEEVSDAVEESVEHVRKAKGNHEGTCSLQ